MILHITMVDFWVKYSTKFGSNDAWKATEVGISQW